MNKALQIELLFSVVLFSLVGALVNPFHFWMPTSLHMVLIAGLLVAFSVIAFLILQRTPLDERENILALQAYKTAYLVTTTLVIMGIVMQSLEHAIDPWLIMIFIGLVLTKIVTVGFVLLKN